MLSKLSQFVLAGIGVLAVLVLFNFVSKVPLSGLTASIIDAMPGVDLTDAPPEEPITEEDVSSVANPDTSDADSIDAGTAESTPETQEGESIFTGILDTVSDSVKNFIESDPIIVKSEIAEESTPETLQEPTQKTVSPKGTSPQVKVFVLTQDILESAVNDWLAVQRNIVVDDIKVDPYEGGAYLIVMNYHGGGSGNTPTRLKLFSADNPEVDANTFLSSLSPSQAVRSIAVVAGSSSGSQKTGTVPLIFVVFE